MRKVLWLIVMLLPMAVLAQSAFNGTWKIDDSKWQTDPKPEVMELKHGMFTCSTCDPKISVKASGTYQKIANDPGADAAKVTVVNPHTIALTEKKDGKVTVHIVATVSRDGKTLQRKAEMTALDGTKTSFATTLTRTGKADPKAHATSGSWVQQKTGSSKPMILTYVSSGDDLSFKGNDGESYNVKLDGKEYPFQWMPGTTTVSVKKIDDNTIEETYKSATGDVVFVAHISVSADGRTLTQVGLEKHTGRTTTLVADKE